MAETNLINVLYVDDEPHNLRSFTSTFRRHFNVYTALSAKDAEAILDDHNNIHVLVTDQRMPEKLGTELLADAVKKHPHQTRILISAFIDDEAIIEAEKSELIYRAIGKPWDDEILKAYIEVGYDIFYSKIAQEQLILKRKLYDKEPYKTKKKTPGQKK